MKSLKPRAGLIKKIQLGRRFPAAGLLRLDLISVILLITLALALCIWSRRSGIDRSVDRRCGARVFLARSLRFTGF